MRAVAERSPRFPWLLRTMGVFAYKAPAGLVLTATRQRRLPVLGAALAFPGYLAYAEEIGVEAARELIEEARRRGLVIDSYIGHPSTARVLTEALGVSIEARRAEYKPADKELALVVRLRRRPARPGELEVSLDDLQFLAVYYQRADAEEVG